MIFFMYLFYYFLATVGVIIFSHEISRESVLFGVSVLELILFCGIVLSATLWMKNQQKTRESDPTVETLSFIDIFKPNLIFSLIHAVLAISFVITYLLYQSRHTDYEGLPRNVITVIWMLAIVGTIATLPLLIWFKQSGLYDERRSSQADHSTPSTSFNLLMLDANLAFSYGIKRFSGIIFFIISVLIIRSVSGFIEQLFMSDGLTSAGLLASYILLLILGLLMRGYYDVYQYWRLGQKSGVQAFDFSQNLDLSIKKWGIVTHTIAGLTTFIIGGIILDFLKADSILKETMTYQTLLYTIAFCALMLFIYDYTQNKMSHLFLGYINPPSALDGAIVRGDAQTIRETLNALKATNRYDHEEALRISHAYLLIGDYSSAETHIQQAIDTLSSSPLVDEFTSYLALQKAVLAETYLLQGQPEKAFDSIEQTSLDHAPEVNYFLAEWHYIHDEFEQMGDALKRLENHTSSPYAMQFPYYLLSPVYATYQRLHDKNAPKANWGLANVRSRSSRLLQGQYHLSIARSHRISGDRKKATASLKKALKLAPVGKVATYAQWEQAKP